MTDRLILINLGYLIAGFYNGCFKLESAEVLNADYKEDLEQKSILCELLRLFVNLLNLSSSRTHFSRSTKFADFVNELLSFLLDPEPNSIQIFVNDKTVRNLVTQVIKTKISILKFK